MFAAIGRAIMVGLARLGVTTGARTTMAGAGASGTRLASTAIAKSGTTSQLLKRGKSVLDWALSLWFAADMIKALGGKHDPEVLATDDEQVDQFMSLSTLKDEIMLPPVLVLLFADSSVDGAVVEDVMTQYSIILSGDKGRRGSAISALSIVEYIDEYPIGSFAFAPDTINKILVTIINSDPAISDGEAEEISAVVAAELGDQAKYRYWDYFCFVVDKLDQISVENVAPTISQSPGVNSSLSGSQSQSSGEAEGLN